MIKLATMFLKEVEKLVYESCGFRLTNVGKLKDNEAYDACTFELNQQLIQYRRSKITPTKKGQFVVFWKRENGKCVPFDETDRFDFLFIHVTNQNAYGQWMIPKSVLIKQKIVASGSNPGKRGFRLYAPWDVVTSQQALMTQEWQSMYFVNFNEPIEIHKIPILLKPNL
jgi:hypothetical protein